MKHSGGSWYELSDGTKVQGKANAEAAEALLTGETGTETNLAEVAGADEEQPEPRTLAEVAGADEGQPEARKLAEVEA